VPHGKRGLVLGIWNAHTSVGNIVGSLVATAALSIGGAGDLGEYDANWTMSFIVSACMMFVVAMLILFFLTEHPRDVGLKGCEEEEDGDVEDAPPKGTGVEAPTGKRRLRVGYSVMTRNYTMDGEPIGADAGGGEEMSILSNLKTAFMIPGVVEFSLCLLFAKCIAYTFIYWTPYYLSHNGFSTTDAGYLCTFVDVGGIAGGIIAGFASDRSKKYASVAIVFLLLCIPGLFFFQVLSNSIKASSKPASIALMIMVGMLVNGPYALITTAVSADLGQHESLKGNVALMSVVTAIIDGCGSIGAASQGYLVGYISATYGWEQVFTFLMICCAISCVCLLRLVLKEWGCLGKKRGAAESQADAAGHEPYMRMDPGPPTED